MKITADYIFLSEGKLVSDICIDVGDNGIIKEVTTIAGEETDIVRYKGILVPGLFNCHAHMELAGHHFENTEGVENFLLQMKKAYNSGLFSKNTKQIKTQQDDFYKQGINFVADICNTENSIESKKNSKITFYNFIEVFESYFDKTDEKFKNQLKIQQIFQNNGLLSSLAPHAMYSLSEKMLEIFSKYNTDNKCISTIHFKECSKENDLLKLQQKLYNTLTSNEITFKTKFYREKNTEEVFKALFHIDQAILLVHSIYMNKNECDFIREHYKNSAICICPSSNLKLEGKMAKNEIIEKYSKKVFLGTDGEVSNKKMQILYEMFLFQNYYNQSIEEILSMVTNFPAEFFQQKKMGKIKPGYKPGICLIKNFNKRKMMLTKESESERIF